MMTYEEVIEFAKEHYCEGGDGTYECLDRSDYERNIAEGVVFTKESLLEDFAIWKSICDEYKAEADW